MSGFLVIGALVVVYVAAIYVRDYAESRADENKAAKGVAAGLNVLGVILKVFGWMLEKMYGIILIVLGFLVLLLVREMAFFEGIDAGGLFAGAILIIISLLQLFDVW